MTLSTLVPLCVVCASRGSQREVVKIKQAKRYFRITNLVNLRNRKGEERRRGKPRVTSVTIILSETTFR